MSDVPSELLSIIFFRVPAEHLIRLRCVCKAWCRLIDDPYFNETHTSNWINKDTSNIHLLHLKHYCKPLLLSLNPFNYSDKVSSMKFNPERIPSTLWTYASNFLTCNGLILIQRFIGSSSWSIINPLSQEFYELPWLNEKDQRDLKSMSIAIGFGYDYATNDYKIVIRNREFGTTFVYRLKSNSWKKIDDFLDIVMWSRGVFCNGALHWIAKLEKKIVAFNLESETIQVYSIPNKPKLDVLPPVLGELGGRLSLTRYIYFDKSKRSKRLISQIWIMDKYGDENSWSLLYENSTSFEDPRWRPISLSASKEYLLLLKKSTGFLFVNLKDNTLKTIDFPTGHPEVDHSEICMFQPSLARITSEQITTGNIKLEEEITTREKLKEPKLKKCNIKLEEQITSRVKLKEPKLKKRRKLFII